MNDTTSDLAGFPVFHDKAGREVHVGDYIVYGHAMGRCAGLRYGVVLSVQWSKEEIRHFNRLTKEYESRKVPKVRVQGVDDDWASIDPRLCKPGTLGFPDRVLRVDAIDIPFQTLKLLMLAKEKL